ncbi:MAG: hypothetical protein KF832_00250 [Caldilineaceae bacterium]|nr:hypothetical protein [Caldilineaceae bacterium]
MDIEQTQRNSIQSLSPMPSTWHWGRLRRLLFYLLTFALVLCLSGGSTLTATEARQRGMAMIVTGWNFDLLSWEVEAVAAKLRALLNQPAYGLTYPESISLVQEYLARAQQIRQLESDINRRFVENHHQATPEIKESQQAVTMLRVQQQQQRPTVEQIIERQIAHELQLAGLEWANLAFPPVQFTFVEPPRKLVVSPRNRITTIYSQMLDAEMSIDTIEQSEAAYRAQYNSSAYITNIGGLGAFPTMVIDRASLAWILSTVAHEWCHNYLTLFPLGMHYLASADLTTINETVAEIVGNEIGDRALRTFYPDQVPPPTSDVPTQPTAPTEPPTFDFDAEMRTTRVQVDDLLAQGEVEAAERYMEARRLYFVDHGYPLRVLNQAYFAFHGSYGTSPASTSPIGPKLEALRTLTPNLQTFLQVVRGITSAAELDALLADWQNH